MLSDPKTLSAIIAGLINEKPKTRRSSKPSRTYPSRYEGSMGGEQLAVLLSMGLTDRDLDYMGSKQRAMIEDVIDLHTRKSAAA